MKAKIWIFVIGFLILAALAVGVTALFYAASNVDQYRPLLEKNLSRALGNPVKMSGISLVWSGGVAAEARDLAVTESGQTVISVRRAAMKLDPWALMSRRLVIQSIDIVEPKFAVTKSADGNLKVRGVQPTPTKPGPATSAGAGMGAWQLLIQNIRIRDAGIAFRDESTVPARATIVQHIDADIRNVSLEGPVTLTAKAAVFGDQQNVNAALKASAFTTGRPKLEDVEIRVDLDLIDPVQLGRFAPEVTAAIEGPLAGKFTLKAPHLVVGGKTPDFTAQSELTGASAQLRAIRPKIDRLDVKANATQQTAKLDGMTVSLAGGKINLQGLVNGYMAPGAASRVDVTAQGLRIEKFLTPDKSGETILEGVVGGAFVGNATGLDAPSIQRTLDGKLTVDFPQGLMLNLNIVRTVLGKLGTMFPGLVQQVESRLPENYRSKLTEQSTILKPFRHEFRVQNGVMLVRGLSVGTDFFLASLEGDLQLTGEFNGRGTIQLDATFSNALFEGAPTLRALANAASLVELPLKIRYHNNKLSVLPDLEAIGQRLIPQAGQQLLSQFLTSGSQAAASSAPASGTASGAASGSAPAAAGSSGSGTSDLMSQLQGMLGAAMEEQNNSQ